MKEAAHSRSVLLSIVLPQDIYVLELSLLWMHRGHSTCWWRRSVLPCCCYLCCVYVVYILLGVLTQVMSRWSCRGNVCYEYHDDPQRRPLERTKLLWWFFKQMKRFPFPKAMLLGIINAMHGMFYGKKKNFWCQLAGCSFGLFFGLAFMPSNEWWRGLRQQQPDMTTVDLRRNT